MKSQHSRRAPSAEARDRGIARAVFVAVREALRDLGVDAAELPQAPRRPTTTGPQADALLEHAERVLADPAVAIQLSRQVPIGSITLLDYAFYASATVRDGLARLVRYYGVISERSSVSLREVRDRAEVVFVPHEGAVVGRHWIELCLAIIVDRLRHALGPTFKPLEVCFAHQGPGPAAYREYFHAPVHFAKPPSRVVLERAWLDTPLRTAATAIVDQLDARLSELQPESEVLLRRLRAALVERFDGGGTSQRAVARALGVSVRTLQRELQRRGSSHAKILDELRRTRALSLIEDPTVKLEDIGRRLGFADSSAFFRACRRWTGLTPAALRARSSKG